MSFNMFHFCLVILHVPVNFQQGLHSLVQPGVSSEVFGDGYVWNMRQSGINKHWCLEHGPFQEVLVAEKGWFSSQLCLVYWRVLVLKQCVDMTDQIPTWALNFCQRLQPKKFTTQISHPNFPTPKKKVTPNKPPPEIAARVGQRQLQHNWPRWRHRHCKVGNFAGDFRYQDTWMLLVKHCISWILAKVHDFPEQMLRVVRGCWNVNLTTKYCNFTRLNCFWSFGSASCDVAGTFRNLVLHDFRFSMF